MNKPPPVSATRSAAANPHVQATPPPRGRGRTVVVILALVVIFVGAIWWVNHRNGTGMTQMRGRGRFGGPGMPLPVSIYKAAKGDIHVYLNALGTVTAARTATIRTQISGQLQQIAFQEGQFVHQGDLLAVIDPRPYENSLAQAKAQFDQAQSQLDIATANLRRYQELAHQDSIAQQQVDTAAQQVKQAQGAVELAKAAEATANLNLTYCHITAPFDGRVGLRQVDVGNYVTPGDANGIVVLSQTKPITVIFTLPEDNMSAVATKLQAGAKLPVDAYDRSLTTKIATGTLMTMDNQVDPTTGTFKLRAEFTNEDEHLFPNQFVNIRMLLDTVHNATVIPTSAVERGQDGPFVYVVTPDHTAEPHNVTLGATEGERVAVTKGVQVGDTVVTDGADKLKEGQMVILPGEAPPVWGGSAGGAHEGGKNAAAGRKEKWQGRGGERGNRARKQ